MLVPVRPLPSSVCCRLTSGYVSRRHSTGSLAAPVRRRRSYRSNVVSLERQHEADAFISAVEKWTASRSDLAAVAVVGSWARGEQGHDSDLDLVLLTQNPSVYVDSDEWIPLLAPSARSVLRRDWGAIVERRLILPSCFEVEVGVGQPSWANTDPVDPGTRAVVRGGLRALYDPWGLLADLAAACGESP